MKLTMFQKGLVLVAIPLLFQSAFVLVVVRFQHDHTEAARWAAHTKDVIAHSQEVHTTVSDAHAAVGGYVISADPAFAAPYRDAVRDLPGQHEAIERLIGDNPQQILRYRTLKNAITTLLAWQGDVESLIRGGDARTAADRVKAGHGYALMAAFRREFRLFLEEEERLDRERLVTLERSRERFNWLLVVGAVTAVGSTLVLAYGFRRGISRRFVALELTARRLASGEPLPPPLAGGDEMSHLDQTLRNMAAELTGASAAIRDLYDHAPCGYHSVDPKGTIIAINQTELRWLGRQAEEVVGRIRFADMIAPRSLQLYETTFARVKEHGGAADIELDLLRKDGTTFPVLLNSSAVRGDDGKYLRSRTTLTDMTERKRAETAIRLFADVAQNIPIGLLIYQLDDSGDPPVLRVRSGNREASQLLGVPLDQATGHAVTDVFPAIPADQLGKYTAVAALGEAINLGEFRYGDARVEELWWAVLAFPLPDRCVGVAFQDVTVRRQAEDNVRKLNAELEERVHARTAELESANRDLAQKNTENEMFVYSVSHDLRSPLVNLQGFSRELEKGCQQFIGLLGEETVPPNVHARGQAILQGKITKSVGFIQSAVLRLSGIIDALLRLSRAGRVEYRWEEVDVGQIVEQVVRAAQITIADRAAVIRIGELPFAYGDRTAIEQAFGNLIGNALTYLDPARPGIIEVGARTTGSPIGFQTYFVRDNGLGIAEGHQQKIFQAFQRAHPGVGSGEGLGLAIVARVAERHRGRLWVESRQGEGSTFFIALPADSEASGRLGTTT
jgi:PAS domain S-box-containing protein